MNQEIIQKLQWRYATKAFDATKKLSDAQFSTILESLRLSASSFGLQPWKFVVVRNPALRKELVAHSWNQAQVSEASHLIVFCSYLDMTAEQVVNYIQSICSTRGVTAESLKGYQDMMLGFLDKQDPSKRQAWMKNQIYLALGNLLTTCALMDVDSCPMEGFDPTAYDRILGLEAKGLRSVVVCPVGFRADGDKYAQAKKVRYPVKDIVTYID